MVEPSGSLRTIVCMTRYTPEHGLPGHDRICWASAVGGARHLIRSTGWERACALAAERLTAGEQKCICARRANNRRGR